MGRVKGPRRTPSAAPRLELFVTRIFAPAPSWGCSHPGPAALLGAGLLRLSAQPFTPDQDARHPDFGGCPFCDKDDRGSMERATPCLSQPLILCPLRRGTSAQWPRHVWGHRDCEPVPRSLCMPVMGPRKVPSPRCDRSSISPRQSQVTLLGCHREKLLKMIGRHFSNTKCAESHPSRL